MDVPQFQCNMTKYSRTRPAGCRHRNTLQIHTRNQNSQAAGSTPEPQLLHRAVTARCNPHDLAQMSTAWGVARVVHKEHIHCISSTCQQGKHSYKSFPAALTGVPGPLTSQTVNQQATPTAASMVNAPNVVLQQPYHKSQQQSRQALARLALCCNHQCAHSVT